MSNLRSDDSSRISWIHLSARALVRAPTCKAASPFRFKVNRITSELSRPEIMDTTRLRVRNGDVSSSASRISSGIGWWVVSKLSTVMVVFTYSVNYASFVALGGMCENNFKHHM